MTNASALDNVMAQAEAAAGNFQAPAVPGVGTAPAVLPTAANQNSVGALAKPSMADFIDSGGMDVDEYFRVKAEGFKVGDTMQGLIDELIVEIDLTEVLPIYSARFESGGNTTFIKSYDGVSTPDGKNFQAEVDRLARINQKSSGIYQTAEIPCVLVDDLDDPKKGSSVKIDAETRVGLTPSVTGFKPFQSFMRRLRQSNPDLLQDTVKVKLVHEKKTNRNNNEWGVINFELLA
ncbi:hypothetical protein [Sphingomonas jaspsi]|uniref:hypothetical protein n=1 Tax=Sphingomonas jaspsi TaxID=392409 RepID=UPI0004AFB9A3|nr:hypothetical protein [Sphingomonas jaspsi]